MVREDLFINTFYAWLEANGVTFTEPMTAPPFAARIDLTQLKIAVIDLIVELGGHFELPPEPANASEVMAALLSGLPTATWAGVEKERTYQFTVAELPSGKRFRVEVEEMTE
ncbi:MAG TPA: hypothetical protein VHZ03_15735 [Trebonia sp.]|jgi:hypothetical protein|nr:hypothetical protein [Trebonia sp.]